jgi:PilX N-terminal
MRTSLRATTRNEDGYALLATMLLLVLLTVIGVAATHTSHIEAQIAGNEKRISADFNKAEGALIQTLEDYNDWMTIDFLTASDPDEAEWDDKADPLDVDGDGQPDVNVEIRYIKNTSTPVDGLSDFANTVPVENHIGPPPPVIPPSSMNQFIIRKFAVSVTTIDGGHKLQAGVFRLFNKI